MNPNTKIKALGMIQLTPQSKSTFCILTYGNYFLWSGHISPNDMNEIVGYSKMGTWEASLSELTALLLIDYFYTTSDYETSTEEPSIWFGFHLKTRLVHGYKVLKKRMGDELPEPFRILGESAFIEDKALHSEYHRARGSSTLRKLLSPLY